MCCLLRGVRNAILILGIPCKFCPSLRYFKEQETMVDCNLGVLERHPRKRGWML